jgi:Flp pilus assembly protein TadD
LGAAERRAGDLAGATAHFRQAVKAAPKDKQAHYNLGACLSDAGQLDEAAAEIKAATALDGKYALAWRRLASVELKRGQCAAARVAFAEFFRLAPKQSRAEADQALAACKSK